MKPLVLAARLIFGAWMLANGANYFFLSLWSLPAGHEPLAIQLMAAFSHSGLLGVAMTLELLGGALILAGLWVPAALCVLMPVSTCALFWSVILDHQPLEMLLGVAAFALNGLLMLAYLDYYRAALQRHALTFGESPDGRGSFDMLFVNPKGRTARGPYVAALVALLAVAAFYAFRVTGLTAHWCMLMLVYPGLVLLARRLHDMGVSAWLLLIPGALTIAAFAGWLHIVKFAAPVDSVLPLAALIIGGGFMLWGCIGAGQLAANRFGAAATA